MRRYKSRAPKKRELDGLGAALGMMLTPIVLIAALFVPRSKK